MRPSQKWIDSFILICILAGAFVFRFFPINSGIPDHAFMRNDEIHYIRLVIAFLNGDWHVKYFTNPTLFAYMLYGVTATDPMSNFCGQAFS